MSSSPWRYVTCWSANRTLRQPGAASSWPGGDRGGAQRLEAGRLRAELAGVLLEEVRVKRAVGERGVREDAGEQLAVRHEAGHPGLLERGTQDAGRLGARRRGRDDLAEHRVVVNANVTAGDDADIRAHRRRHVDRAQRPGRRQEVALGILRAQPDLDRPAPLRRRGLHALAARDADLLADQIEAGRQLGDRMLDLEPRVDLEEVEAAVGVPRMEGTRRCRDPGDDELDRARADVADRAAERDRSLAHRGAARLVERDRRRLLDDLLVAALDRALALVQVHDVAVRVAEDLDLDVTRPLDVALEQDRVVAERALRLALRTLDRLGQLARAANEPHTLAAAAGARLDQHRVLDVGGARLVPRHDRHARLLREDLGGTLAAELADHVARRPDEHEPGLGDRIGERGVLRQEAIPRMHRIGAGAARGIEDRRDHEIRLARRRRADPRGLVREPDERRVGIGIGVHGHGRDAHRARRPHHAQRDLSAVGDEQLLQCRNTPHDVEPRNGAE